MTMYINSRLLLSGSSRENSVDWVLDGEYGGARTEVEIENLKERIPIILSSKM